MLRAWLVMVAALVVAGCGSASHRGTGIGTRVTGNVAERAFVRWLAQHHPGYHGLSVCPISRLARAANGGIRCIAEIHKGRRYIEDWEIASTRGAGVSFTRYEAGSWIRHWSKYMPPPQGVSPGLISVNATGFDWGWLVLGIDYKCRQKHRITCGADALDGQWAGYSPLFNFRCRVHSANLISCRNELGDGLRWQPHAH